MYYLQLCKARDSDEMMQELDAGNYDGLEEHYTLTDGDYATGVEMVGVVQVDVVTFAGGRCYAKEQVDVWRGSDGKLYVTEAQEEEYFL